MKNFIELLKTAPTNQEVGEWINILSDEEYHILFEHLVGTVTGLYRLNPEIRNIMHFIVEELEKGE